MSKNSSHRQAVAKQFRDDTSDDLSRMLAASSRRGPTSDDGFSNPRRPAGQGIGNPPPSSPSSAASAGDDDPRPDSSSYAAALEDQVSPRGVLMYCL